MTRPRREVSVLQALTAALWLTWLVIGLLGLWLQQFQRPVTPPPHEPPPIKVETVNVELTPDVQPLLASDSAPPDTPQDEPANDAPPAPVPVAIPSPAIAFVLPVEGPTIIAPAARAVPPPLTAVQHPVAPGAGPPSRVVHRLTVVPGAQPEPAYPPQAVAQRQQGTVVVRFVVDPNGNVLSAEAVVPSRWPLLNQSAVETVRRRWRFTPGQLRPYELYDKPIRFELIE